MRSFVYITLHLAASVVARRGLVTYWGCDNPYNAGHKEFLDGSLESFCDRGTYDIVQLAFLDSFLDPRTGHPHLHLHSHHCNATFDSIWGPDVGLLHCPDIARQIKHCQSKGVRVGLSLGGGTGSYYFLSDDQAREFARTLWEMFFVSDNNDKTLRPFDDAVLDGMGLDIEGGTGIGYVAFIEEFFGLSQSVTSFLGTVQKPIYIGGAPQCTDVKGEGFMWSMITQGAKFFTHMWPQFYNNFCSYPSGYNGARWQSELERLNPSIKWFSGIPAASSAGGGFVGQDVNGLVQASQGFANWDGIMMWDASWDEFNGWYSDTVRVALDGLDSSIV